MPGGNPDEFGDVLSRVAFSSAHGHRLVWLLLFVIRQGGETPWHDAIVIYASEKGWTLEQARKKLNEAYVQLKTWGILRKRRKRVGVPEEAVYVSLTPAARALLLRSCP